MPDAHTPDADRTARSVVLERAARRAERMMVPRYTTEPGRVVVDSTWGRIQPLQIAPGVRTVGELDVIAHVHAGGRLVDTRRAEQHEQATIPGARAIAHEDIVTRADELDGDDPIVLFCNGPQCAATPTAVRALLSAGFSAERLLYYRGGVHDWMTLGLPVLGTRADEQQADLPDDRPGGPDG